MKETAHFIKIISSIILNLILAAFLIHTYRANQIEMEYFDKIQKEHIQAIRAAKNCECDTTYQIKTGTIIKILSK